MLGAWIGIILFATVSTFWFHQEIKDGIAHEAAGVTAATLSDDSLTEEIKHLIDNLAR